MFKTCSSSTFRIYRIPLALVTKVLCELKGKGSEFRDFSGETGAIKALPSQYTQRHHFKTSGGLDERVALDFEWRRI